jgi:hypothetical protein
MTMHVTVSSAERGRETEGGHEEYGLVPLQDHLLNHSKHAERGKETEKVGGV